MNHKYSRKDLSVEDIEQQIKVVKRDRSFPKRWKQIELDYLYSMKEYLS